MTWSTKTFYQKTKSARRFWNQQRMRSACKGKFDKALHASEHRRIRAVELLLQLAFKVLIPCALGSLMVSVFCDLVEGHITAHFLRTVWTCSVSIIAPTILSFMAMRYVLGRGHLSRKDENRTSS